MATSQFRSKRKVTGKKYVAIRKKKLSELSGIPALTQIGNDKIKEKRVKGANKKKSLLRVSKVCVSNKGKVESLKIESVENNPANINFTRRNIITKGAIVKTSKGKVKITSRPGQVGNLFGVFLK